MSNKLSEAIRTIFNFKLLKFVLSVGSRGYLKDIGWLKSYLNKKPINASDKPIPWLTYSFIEFVKERLNSEITVFEFGSGNSTIWYANKVKEIHALEHDKSWFETIRSLLPENANVYFSELKEDKYYSYLKKLDLKFEIIIVDGRERVNCIMHSVKYLTNNGVLILDDSERDFYQEGINFLLDSGFRKIDFWGISPGVFFNKCTTIFYKSNNCLNI